MRLWPPSGEAPRRGRSPGLPPSTTTLSPRTGNRRLDRQLRAARERETARGAGADRRLARAQAARARRLMLDACGGAALAAGVGRRVGARARRLPRRLLHSAKMDELPAVEAGADEVGGVWARLQVRLPCAPRSWRRVLTGSSAISFEPVRAASGAGHGVHLLAGGRRRWLAWFSRRSIEPGGDKLGSVDMRGRSAAQAEHSLVGLAHADGALSRRSSRTNGEFMAPPIGLRSPITKLLLYHFRIPKHLFQSAATGLAFTLSTLSDSCYVSSTSQFRQRLRALPWMLLLAGMAWAAVFTVSVSRLLVAATTPPAPRFRRRRIRGVRHV